ncbi:MAG: bifunctional UDP-N-acetylglucosamine diphosphorylase/glucosamine-1-phosphate N-acetyltransferase GlmU [Gammaproteobacteria bacterium]|nr:bifunctional UDP-N-acetylglucosamine diphosphorylase/glucosamine-1-phosphate N-acetyltransferase GlmU [Gammaproteobacteria bacterium]
MSIKAVILAAGKGTRMRSSKPKVLHEIGGIPLLQHVLNTVKQMDDAEALVIYGHGGDQVIETIDHDGEWVEQREQRGTGHAVQQALPFVDTDDTVLILYGDVPLIQQETLNKVLHHGKNNEVGLLIFNMDDPTGYGRVICDHNGNVQKIVEQKDATDHELQCQSINSGIMSVPGGKLHQWLTDLKPNNVQGEYYLTDIIHMAVKDGVKVNTESVMDEAEITGVNDKMQLAQLERAYQQRCAEQLMQQGVTLLDPQRFDLRGCITDLGQDVCIDVNVILEGKVLIGQHVRIGANCIIKNSTIGDHVEILPNSVIEDAEVGANCVIGPFARLRPGTVLGEKVKIGNFVETKNVNINAASKVNHLSYIGDATIGANVNVGAGTITCNYDGANKHHTTIKDGAFIGSDTQLVAPVVVGENATIAAGSTITRDAPDAQLTLSRVHQFSKDNWKRPKKKS